MERIPLGHRWSLARLEYAADAALHALALAGACWAAVVALSRSLAADDPAIAWSLAVYVAGMFLLGAASAAYNLTLYHGRDGRLRRLDHASIFVMIAGTYTPFCVIAIGGFWGGALLGIVWTLSVQGMVMRLIGWPSREGVASLAYLFVGWVVVLAIVPLIEALPAGGLAWLVLGGVLYSVGVIFYIWDGLHFHRVIWHGFVVAGATSHAVAIFSFVVPAR
ncbi:MAG: PAQR family membrane homeostasis protein TrhA [Pseudomonadota bacterium]